MALDDLQMPSFQDPDGTTYIWDSASKSYVRAPLTDKRPDQSHATGGDNDLFDPFQHTEVGGSPLTEGYMAKSAAWEDDPEGGHYYLECPFCGSDRDYRESRLPGTSGGNLYHCGMCQQYSDPNMTPSKSYDDYHGLHMGDDPRQDENIDNQPGDLTLPEDWKLSFIDEPPFPAHDEVKCPNCGEATKEQVCPTCQKDLTPEWNVQGQENEFLGVHPEFNDAKEWRSWPQNVPKKNEFNYDDSFPSMSLSKRAEVINALDLVDQLRQRTEQQTNPAYALGRATAVAAFDPELREVAEEVYNAWNINPEFTRAWNSALDWAGHEQMPPETKAMYLQEFWQLRQALGSTKTAEALPMDDGWDDVFSGQAPMRTEVGKWILDQFGQMHIEHGMSADHGRIEQRDGLDPSQEIALGSVYNDGTADVQKVAQPDMFNLEETQGLIEQAFGAAVLQPPVGMAYQQAEQIFPPTDLQGGQWFIPPHTGTITGIAWVKERPENSQYQPNMILCAEHLRPEDFALWSQGCPAIITAVGGGASHAAMLAATHNIPVITALGDSYNKLQTGCYLKIEPTSETITVMPGATSEMPSEQKHQIWNDILDYQRQRGGSVSQPEFSHFFEELAWKEANGPNLEECPECRAPMFDRDGEAQCGDCGHKQPILHTAAPLLLGEAALGGEALGGGAAAGGAAGGGGIGGIGSLMNGALGRGMAFRGGENLMGGGSHGGGEAPAGGGGPAPVPFDPNAGTVANTKFAAANMRHEAVLSEIWALIKNALGGLNWNQIGGALAANPIDDALVAGAAGGLGAAHQNAMNNLQQATGATTFGEEEVGLGTKNDGTNSTEEASNSSIEGKKEQGDGPEQLKDVDGGHDSQTPNDSDDLGNQGDPHMQEKALKAFHMNLPLVIEFANSEEPGAENPILAAIDAMLEEAFPGYKDGHDQDSGAESEHPQESETPEERDEDVSEPDAKSEGSDKKEAMKIASVWHYADYLDPQNYDPATPLGWEGGGDRSIGDVIAAYPDGTIVLDDGITTWNMDRARQFAEIHGWSESGSAPGVAADPQMEAERDLGSHLGGQPNAWDIRRGLEGPWDEHLSDPGAQQFDYQQPPAQVQGDPEGWQQGAPTPYSCMNCGEEHQWPSNVNPRDLPACPQCGAQNWTRSGVQQTYATLDPGQGQMGPGVPAGGGGPAMQMCPRCGQAHTAGSPCPVADVTTPLTTGDPTALSPMAEHVVTKWHMAMPSNVPAAQPAIAAGAQAAPATTCPQCGCNHIPGTPCPSYNQQNQVQAPGASGPMQAPMSPGVQYSHTAADDDHGDYHSDDDWMDESGAPLEEGAQYEMKTAHSPIGTRVTIERILPEKLTYLIHSGDVDYRDKITRDQLEMDGAKFLPVDDSEPDSMDAFPGEELPIRPGQDALPQQDDLSTPSTVMSNFEPISLDTYTGSFDGDKVDDRSWLMEGGSSEVAVDPVLMEKLAAKNYTPREQREFIDEKGEARNLDRLDLSGTHYIDEELGTSDSLW